MGQRYVTLTQTFTDLFASSLFLGAWQKHVFTFSLSACEGRWKGAEWAASTLWYKGLKLDIVKRPLIPPTKVNSTQLNLTHLRDEWGVPMYQASRPFSKPNGLKLVFCSHPGSGPDNRRQAHCSTFVFVAPAVQQSELKTMKSSASEPIFWNMFIDSSTWCT